ncbi:hypothetical protein P3521_20080 [Vibrio parahaemolyticus]|uniref:hypothetical protein n=1 Tax=Vibrio parahaemolyticus TaxID=670 RepID=UPI001869F1E0|nr:hypothetical protein [Vibrio parahaemolyticus]MBE3793539.1 hypothetical protein [Vibrio parahaemolyticus]MBE3866399.1 hypothetical protein [Vibrio parahaemolyticus]MCZ5880335.1 hypothetical protein [Vibrio parahaemolyticus]MDF4424228.1 hypothetical protein [Vibrio parahaemolyticus]MDF4671933.1 hypothetical protein [Vibrio parahaemolyticus]
MLAFLKKWRKAYLEDKGDRLHAQVEAERNALCNGDCLSFGEATSIFSTSCKDKVVIKSHTGTEEECMVKGYYY